MHRLLLSAFVLVTGCATHAAAVVPSTTLPASLGDGVPAEAKLVDPAAKVTVLEFFSAHCPCQAQHDARLRALHDHYAPLGASFRAVSSEESLDRAGEAKEAARRHYPFPLVHDEGGQLARSLGADYATYTLVVDPQGKVLYRGGIDSDKRDLHDDARPYLANALDDALADRPVRVPEAKTLGCALQIH